MHCVASTRNSHEKNKKTKRRGSEGPVGLLTAPREIVISITTQQRNSQLRGEVKLKFVLIFFASKKAGVRNSAMKLEVLDRPEIEGPVGLLLLTF